MSESSNESLLVEVDELLQKAATISDPASRDLITSTVRALMELHGAALARITEKSTPAQLAAFAADETISGLLLLYGLHPQDLSMRVQAALQSVATTLASHGGSVELLNISSESEVRLQLNGRGCASTTAHLKQSIENAIYQKAPDTTAIHFESSETNSAKAGFVPIDALLTSTRRRATQPELIEGAMS